MDVDDVTPCIFGPSSSCPQVNLKTMLNLDKKLRARQPYFRAIELHLGCNGLRATAQRGDVTCYKTSYFWALCQTLALTLLLHQSTFQLTALFHTSPFTFHSNVITVLPTSDSSVLASNLFFSFCELFASRCVDYGTVILRALREIGFGPKFRKT